MNFTGKSSYPSSIYSRKLVLFSMFKKYLVKNKNFALQIDSFFQISLSFCETLILK